jgi:predicted transcriptional regulator
MARERGELSAAEQEVLKTLWELGSGTVRDVFDALSRDGRGRAYTTVLTFLARLEGKGYVESRKQGLANVFQPRVSRDGLLTQRLNKLVDDFCEGTAAPVVQALVRGKQLSSGDIAHLRRLLDELEQAEESPARPTGRKRKK